MNNGRERSDTHKAFCEKMREANELYVRETFQAPEMGDELRRRIRQKQRSMRYKRIGRCAAMFMVVLLTSVSAGVWMNADGTYGGKQFSKKVTRIMSPLEIKNVTDEEGNQLEVVRIKDWDDMESAAEFCGQMYVPGYIPPEYEFYQLTIRKGENFLQQEYVYKDSEKKPLYIDFDFDTSDKSIAVLGEPYRSPRTGEQFYVSEIKETNEFAVTKVADDYECGVTGFGSKNIGIRIMENLERL